jgi:hypothetical protein
MLRRVARDGLRAGLILGIGASVLVPGIAGAATITPDTIADVGPGDCSLRDAVSSVNSGAFADLCASAATGTLGTADVIQLQPGGVYNLVVSGDGEDLNATGDLDVRADLTIQGDAANRPVIRGGASIPDIDRVIHVPTSVNLTLKDLIVSDGRLDTPNTDGQLGGNIYYQGGSGKTLDLNHADVTGGLAQTFSSGDKGGGIAADGGGLVKVENGSLIDGNVVGPSTAGSFFGGGIYIGGPGTDLTIQNSAVSNNNAGLATDAFPNPNGGFGGGIELEATGGGVVNTFNSATITGNHAGGGKANVTGAGGGVRAIGAQSISFDGGTVSNNTAGGGASGTTGDGGGMFLSNTGGTITLNNGVHINGNTAGGTNAQGFGGGIKISASATPTSLSMAFGNGEIKNNQAGVGSTSGVGGGVEFSSTTASPTPSDMIIANTEVSGNSAQSTGGGIRMVSDHGVMGINNSNVSNNTAGDGGGIHRTTVNTPSGADSISRSTVAGNTGGQGGGIYIGKDVAPQLTESTVSGNHATSNQGSGLHEGGGIYTASDLEVQNSTIYNNDANATGGIGGGIRTDNITPNGPPLVSTIFATIAQNSATDRGGNIYAEGANASDRIQPVATIVANGTSTNFPATGNCAERDAGGSTDTTGVIASDGYNIEGANPSQCEFTTGTDLATNASLGLGPLGSHGTAQNTIPLLPDSPAIDFFTAVNCQGALSTDERFVGRPQGPACDVGAYEAEYFSLTVNASGSGTVTGTGINCPGDCSESKSENTQIALTATPASGSLFTGWSGGGCASAATCNVTLDASKSVTANFAAIPPVASMPAGSTTQPPATAPAKKCKKAKKGAVAAKKCKKKKKK